MASVSSSPESRSYFQTTQSCNITSITTHQPSVNLDTHGCQKHGGVRQNWISGIFFLSSKNYILRHVLSLHEFRCVIVLNAQIRFLWHPCSFPAYNILYSVHTLKTFVPITSKNLASGWRGDARPPHFIISTITYEVVVYAPAERADTLLFPCISLNRAPCFFL